MGFLKVVLLPGVIPVSCFCKDQQFTKVNSKYQLREQKVTHLENEMLKTFV